MAVVIGSAASANSGSLLAPYLKFNKTVAAGANLLVVLVSLRDDAASVAAVSSVTYAGASLTRLISKSNSAGEMRAEIWYLKNPPAGTWEVYITNGEALFTAAGAVDISGADASSPFGAPATAVSNGATGASVSVAAGSGSIVLDVLAKKGSDEIPAPGASQSQLYLSSTTDTVAPSGNVVGCASWKDAGAGGDVPMSWSWEATARQFVLIGVAVRAPQSALQVIGNVDTGDSAGSMLSSLSFSHTVLEGANLLVLGFASCYAGSTAPAITSATFNNIPLTKLAQQYCGGSPKEIDAEIWYLVDPPVGAAYTIALALDKSGRFAAGAFDICGGDTSTPFGEPVLASPTDTAASVSATVESAKGDIVLDMLAVRSNNNTITTGNDQVQIWKDWSTYSSSVTSNPTGLQTYKAGAPSVVMSQSINVARSCAYIAVSVHLKSHSSKQFQCVWWN